MRAGWTFVIASLLVSGACKSPQHTSELRFTAQSFTTESGDTVQGEIARLRVPERHEVVDARSIALAVARFPSTSEDPGPPIIYLAGGPGAAGIHPERMPLYEKLREFADVVTFDQRGTGQSTPSLECRETAELGAGMDATWPNLLALHREIATACASRLRGLGIDLSAYNARQSVEDMESLRLALGVNRIQLVGMSFGSHLGLATLKQHGDQVSRAIFAGVEGLDQTIKLPSNIDAHLQMVSELIAADPVAGAILPDFQELVLQTIERLETDGPFEVELNDGSMLRLTAFEFRAAVAGSIVRRQFLRLIPLEYGPIRDGDFSNLAGGVPRARTFGMRAAMDCSSGFSAERWRRVVSERESSSLRGVSDFPYPDVCDAWRVEDLGDSFRSAKVFELPVQFISGALDGLTPISNVEEIRGSFPRSGHIVVERMGHEGPGIWFGSPEMMGLLGAFLRGGEPVTTRISAPPIDWALPESQ